MKRRDFLASCAGVLASPGIVKAQTVNRVIVVGAGAAGMTAAYHLKRSGVDVTVLEASNRWGGRVKRSTTLADVPLDLGAEWVHTDATVFGEILDQGASDMGMETIAYRPETYQFWNRGKLKDFNAASNFYEEVKFRDTTWYGFFERFMASTVKDSIRFNSPVTQIATDTSGVSVTTRGGQVFTADRVIVTVPISQLKQGKIALPSTAKRKLGDLNDVAFGKGYKVFLRFQDRFYPDMLFFGSRLTALQDSWDSKIYYDAAFRKPTDANILGLFNVDHDTLPRVDLGDAAFIEDVLNELTEIYSSVVRDSFIKAEVQNWSAVPFIGGSYSMTNDSDAWLSDILAPIDGKIYFAGEALGGDAQSTVHGAAFSALTALEQIYG
ncbi:MAG: NAD(P)/FAD-dependent oxidoreductase [Pseudomonadota bacterium]